MLNHEGFDPDLPTASAVLASLCCVITRYTSNHSPELAELAVSLSLKLSATPDAESPMISEIAKRMEQAWESKLLEDRLATVSVVADSLALH